MAKQFFNFTSKRETDYQLVWPKRSRQSLMDLSLDDESFEPIRIVGNGKPKGSLQISNRHKAFKDFCEIELIKHRGFDRRTKRDKEIDAPEYEQALQKMREFVKRYGRLTDDKKGDNVHLLLDEAGRMKHLWETFKGRKQKLKLGSIFTSPSVPDDFKATVSLDPETRNIDIQLWPKTLLQALWLQLFYSLSRGGGELRECGRPGCTNTFSVGAGGKRKDAKFCSKECRVLFNSLERSNPALRGERK